jgi:hexosaminidase
MLLVYGAYHALETLSQLMQFSFETESYFIRDAPWSIFDFPRFPHRGIMIDSSRHFEPVETIKGVIDSLTYAKFNTLHWHIVDWQSFPFDSPSFPLLAEMGAYSEYERYTVDDVADVVEFARERGVRVMVEIGEMSLFCSCCGDGVQTRLGMHRRCAMGIPRSVHQLTARCR